MRLPRPGRLILAVLVLMSGGLAALGAGCALGPPTRAPAAPLEVSAIASSVPTRSVEPSVSVPATVSAPASETAPVSAKPVAWAARLLPPIAVLPSPGPVTEITGPRDLAVPILMYHVIGIAPAGARNSDLYVTPVEFVAQMRYLSSHGYHAVTLQQVYDFWHKGRSLPDKPVVLSFDDGDTPDFTIVAPLLNELHWPGVLNLIVGRHKLRFKKPIVRALINSGWEIDSHTVTHTEVRGLSAKRLTFEVTQSRTKLQKLYGVPVNFFCYPSGRFDGAAVAAVKKAGYLGATTTMGGLARPNKPFLLRRVRVSGGHSVKSFRRLLKLYD